MPGPARIHGNWFQNWLKGLDSRLKQLLSSLSPKSSRKEKGESDPEAIALREMDFVLLAEI